MELFKNLLKLLIYRYFLFKKDFPVLQLKEGKDICNIFVENSARRVNKAVIRMRSFSVFPTDRNKGFIELVPSAVTLREIQSGAGNGISGSLKERPLQTWLLRQRLDWHQVVDNFTRSCAAYCVATYILGNS